MILPAWMLLNTTYVHAEQAFDPKGTYFFGDWQGKRTELEKKGIKFKSHLRADSSYLANVRCNPSADGS